MRLHGTKPLPLMASDAGGMAASIGLTNTGLATVNCNSIPDHKLSLRRTLLLIEDGPTFIDTITISNFTDDAVELPVSLALCAAFQDTGPIVWPSTTSSGRIALSASHILNIRKKTKVGARYDRRDISRIWVEVAPGTHVQTRWRDLGLPPMTLWERISARKRLRAQGRQDHDARAIGYAVLEQRAIGEAEVRVTVKARRNRPSGGSSDRDAMMALLRTLTGELKISLVCAGTSEAENALLGDEQLASRYEPLSLQAWQPSTEFQGLVGTRAVAAGKLRLIRRTSFKKVNC